VPFILTVYLPDRQVRERAPTDPRFARKTAAVKTDKKGRQIEKHWDSAYLRQGTTYQCRDTNSDLYPDPWSGSPPKFNLLLIGQPSLKISCKSVQKFLRKVANRQTDKQRRQQRLPWRRYLHISNGCRSLVGLYHRTYLSVCLLHSVCNTTQLENGSTQSQYILYFTEAIHPHRTAYFGVTCF